jgi:4-amino-4-deoxy-L-arabinose transferase-like glycosyltransferase
MPRRQLLYLALIMLLACALRVINLGGRSLWYDEAFAVLFSEKGLDAMLSGTLTPVSGGASDIHPLLYYSTLNVWMIVFGESAFGVRLLSVVFGVATVGAIYGLARELFGEKTALAAALIMAIAPFHVQYSQETRMYALLGMLLSLATWCFVKGWRGKSWRWWIAFGVLAGLAMYTQQLAAFYLVALGLVPVITRRKDQLIRVGVGAIVAIVVYLPWLVNLPGQLEKVRSYYWLEPPNIAKPLGTMYSFLVVNLDIPAPYSMIGLLGSLFLILFLIIQVVLYLRRRVRSDRKPLLFVLWLAVFPLALMWLVSQVQPVYLERALLPSALMLYVALGWLFTHSGLPRPIASIIAAVGLVMVGIGLYHQYTIATFPNSPFQTASLYIRYNWQDGDVIVHQDKMSALPTVYYARDLTQRFLGDLPGSSEDTLALPTQQSLGLKADDCIQSAGYDAERIWWVMFDFVEAQYQGSNRLEELQQSLDWLNEHYTRSDVQHFNDLELALYTDPHGDLKGDCTSS